MPKNTKKSVDDFFRDVVLWAKQNLVLAVILLGSHARNEQTADSDIDLVIISPNPQKLLSEQNWLNDFGDFEHVRKEDYGLITSLRVHYDFAEVEFGIGSPEWLEATAYDRQTRQVIKDGYKILYDPEKLLKHAVTR